MRSAEFTGAEDALTGEILNTFYEVYRELGCGFLESVYRRSMEIALVSKTLLVRTEVPIPVFFRGEDVGTFRADIVVADLVVLELKVAEQITKAHEAQLTHYLRSSKFEIGLILNFGDSPRVKRVDFPNNRKHALRERPALS